VDFSVLGPLQVRVSGESVAIRRGLPRLLLTYLLLHVGEPIAASVLAERIWNEEPPSDPANAVHQVVSYLRRIIGSRSELPLRTTGGGYVLDVPRDAVDAHRFAALVRGCGPDPERALAKLDEALELWRGEPFVDAAGLPWAAPHIAELEELHLLAQERRLTCLLDLGRHVDAIPQAHALASAYPLREGLHVSLMLALYRSGRQSDALAAAAALRRTLLEELGLDPSPEVLDLERRILNHDPGLGAPQVRIATPPEPEPRRSAMADGDKGHSRPARRTGVPKPLTSLIGRDDEIAAVGRALDDVRLLTLTGPGGTGKTRLALAVLEVGSYHPVWFADLSGAADDATVGSVVAAATGASTTPDTDVVDAVVGQIADSTGVLVLDNCEHVLPAAARITAAVLRHCPQVRQLATSRRPLAVTGEVTWPVPPLGLPPADGYGSAADVATAASVELFAQRAAMVAPGFRVDDTNADDIAAICRALDGLPLAIELAAGHADVLSPSGVRRRLDDRFAFLVSGASDVDERQQTLRAAISSSVDLLEPHERVIFSQLGVFVGSFDLDAAAAVTASTRTGGHDCFRVLVSLVRQSLVTRAGSDRYRLLDSLRAYAAEMLQRSPDEAAVRRRHAEHHLSLAEEADTQVRTQAQQRWLELLREIQPDLRAALTWCLDGNAPETGARLVAALAWFWTLEGLLAEAGSWLDRAERLHIPDPHVRSRVLLGVGLVAAPLGHLERAREACALAAELGRSVGEDRATGDALITLGVALWGLDDLDGAAAAHDEAIQRFTAPDDFWRRDVAVILRARTAVDRGDADATERVSIALSSARKSGDAHLLGLALSQQARDALRAGRAEEAVAAASDALRAYRRIHYREGEAAALTLLARAHLPAGAARANGLAADAARQALQTAAAINHRGALCHAVEALGAVHAADGDDHRALVLLEVAAADRQNRTLPCPRVEREMTATLAASLRGRLGPQVVAAVREAAATTVDDIVAQCSGSLAGDGTEPPGE
jgi:predicted ATPase/DNA-binding SARP family transcriptional activator